MTSSAAELTPTAKNRTMALPSARRLLLWTGLAVLIAWVLVPIYLVALGAFGGTARRVPLAEIDLAHGPVLCGR